MKYLAEKFISIKLVGVFFIIILNGTVFAGCASQALYDIPLPQSITNPPVQIELDGFQLECQNDPTMAQVRYGGMRLLFLGVTVDWVCRLGRNRDPYFLAGAVKFRPRYTNSLERVTRGTLVDVAGDYHGTEDGYIVFGNCWIKVIGGLSTFSPAY